MDKVLIFYYSQKFKQSQEKAILFYKTEGYIHRDYFHKENEKWGCYGGTVTESKRICFPRAISSFLKKMRTRKVRRFYQGSQIKDFTKNAITGFIYPWEKKSVG